MALPSVNVWLSRPAEDDVFGVVGGDAAFAAVGGDGAAVDRDRTDEGEDAVVAALGGDGAAVDRDGGGVAVGVDAVIVALGGDCAAVDRDVAVVDVDAGAAVGGGGARTVCLAVDGEAIAEFDCVTVLVRDGEGRAVAENQVGDVDVEPSADGDVGGDDVPSASAAVRDVARGVGEDGVVGADLLVAVRVDVRDGGQPCGGEQHDGVLGVGEVADCRAVRVDGAVRATPAGEGAVRASEGVG